VLGPPQPDWPANTVATGFPFLEHANGLSPEIRRFLDDGEPPIVFTLGSARSATRAISTSTVSTPSPDWGGGRCS